MNPTSMILVFGIIVGIAIALAVIKGLNKDHKVRTKYDERQLRARGDAYRYGFFVTIFACVLFMVLEAAGSLEVLGYSSYFIAILIGIITQFTYSIFHDAYIGLNTNMKKYLIFMSIVGAINLASGILPMIHGEFMEDGKFGTGFMNLLCGGMFLILAGELAVKKMLDKKAD